MNNAQDKVGTGKDASGTKEAPLLWRDRHPKLRRALRTTIILLLVLTAVGFLLPIWASTPQGRKYALEHINRRINGKLEVNSWKLSWFTGMTLEGVRLRASDEQIVLDCTSIKSDLTLWGLVSGNYDVGTMEFNAPAIRLRRYADGSNDLGRIWYGTPPGAQTQPAEAGGGTIARSDGPWQLQSLRGGIRVKYGEIELSLVNAEGQKQPLPLRLTAVTGEMPIAGADSPIHVTLQARSRVGNQSGLVDLKGDLPAVATWGQNPGAFLRNLQLTAGQVPVETVCTWLGMRGSWETVLGPVLDEVLLNTHAALTYPGQTNAPSIALARVRSSVAEVDLRVLLENRMVSSLPTGPGTQGSEGKEELSLTVPDSQDFYARAKVRCGPPVLEYLGYLCPLFREGQPGVGSVEASVGTGKVIVEQAQMANVNMLVNITGLKISPSPPMRMTTGTGGAGTGGTTKRLFEQIVGVTGMPAAGQAGDLEEEADAGGGDGTMGLEIPTMKVTIGRGEVRAEPVQVMLNARTRWTFTGTVGVEGRVHLLMTLPLENRPGAASETLGGATLQLPVNGTVWQPVLQLPSTAVPGELPGLVPTTRKLLPETMPGKTK